MLAAVVSLTALTLLIRVTFPLGLELLLLLLWHALLVLLLLLRLVLLLEEAALAASSATGSLGTQLVEKARLIRLRLSLIGLAVTLLLRATTTRLRIRELRLLASLTGLRERSKRTTRRSVHGSSEI